MACIILCCGLGNTSFVGYPILQHFYGNDSLRYAIFVDQPGSFLILSTLGVLIAAYFSSGTFSVHETILKLIKFPPFILFIISLFIPSTFIKGNIYDGLDALGKLMIPLAILSLGMQFQLKLDDIEWKKFFLGILYKLIIAPLIIYILFYFILNKQSELYTISIMECAMPPMVTSSIMAMEHNLDRKLTGILPTLGILFSIITLLMWKWIL